MASLWMSRGVNRCSSRAASGPSSVYFISGETSISAAWLRIAQYSRSRPRSYEPTALWPAQRRQLCGGHSAAVRLWNGVRFSWYSGRCALEISGTVGSRLQVGVQQPVEELLARFASHGEPARVVGARVQAALHRPADAFVLVLHPVGDVDRGAVEL